MGQLDLGAYFEKLAELYGVRRLRGLIERPAGSPHLHSGGMVPRLRGITGAKVSIALCQGEFL